MRPLAVGVVLSCILRRIMQEAQPGVRLAAREKWSKSRPPCPALRRTTTACVNTALRQRRNKPSYQPARRVDWLAIGFGRARGCLQRLRSDWSRGPGSRKKLLLRLGLVAWCKERRLAPRRRSADSRDGFRRV